jgi:superfamily I DNA/RNA helicase
LPQGLAAFLDDLALARAGPAVDEAFDKLEGKGTDKGDKAECVSLMTLHASKGLEFSTVFIAGMVRCITLVEYSRDTILFVIPIHF